MSIIPEFIEPITESPKKPDPIAGLGEYLQSQIGDLVKNLTPIKQVDEFFDYLKGNPNAILWLDLEINPTTQALIDGAILTEGQYWYFSQKEFYNHANSIYHLLKQANFLGGHNLIEFDLP